MAVMLFEAGVPKRLARLGDMTFFIYLLHLPVIRIAELIFKNLPESRHLIVTQSGVFAIAIIATTFGLSVLAYRFIERPTQRLGSRLARLIEEPAHAPAAATKLP